MTRLHPDKAPLAFRVGIVGHRPDRLPQDGAGQAAIEARLGEVVAAIAESLEAFRADAAEKISTDLYSDAPAVLTAVTPLAEGSDRMFARAALGRGYRLFCPLPFAADEYEKDFDGPASVAEFRGLLAQANTNGSVLAMDGRRQAEDAGYPYGAAGAVVVNQSDLLIAVWDGDRAADKPHGTFDIIELALKYHLPVLWIDAKAPFAWRVLKSGSAFKDLTSHGAAVLPDAAPAPDDLRAAVAEIVRDELRLPTDDTLEERAEGGGHETATSQNLRNAEDYFKEWQRRVNLNFTWKIFRNLMAGEKVESIGFLIKPYLASVEAEWLRPGQNPAILDSARQLLRHFAFADKQADIYADAHRSAVLYTSFLAAFAVVLAVLPFSWAWLFDILPGQTLLGWDLSEWKGCVAGLEVIDLLTLIWTLYVSRRQRWHARWLEYRMLAEWIRQLRLLVALGGGRPTPRTPPQMVVYGRPTHSWMYWHMRAITRGVKVPSTVVDQAFKTSFLNDLMSEVSDTSSGQDRFHRRNYERCLRINERLEGLAEFFVNLSLTCVLLHVVCLAIEMWLLPKGAEGFLPIGLAAISALTLIFTAGGPALVAALANINNQGEFARISKRSLAMSSWMKQMYTQSQALLGRVAKNEPAADLNELNELAQRVTNSMVQEVADWRTLVHDRPQAPA